MEKREQKLLAAARVIALTAGSRSYLEKNDPKALEQLEDALEAYDRPEIIEYLELLHKYQDIHHQKVLEYRNGRSFKFLERADVINKMWELKQSFTDKAKLELNWGD